MSLWIGSFTTSFLIIYSYFIPLFHWLGHQIKYYIKLIKENIPIFDIDLRESVLLAIGFSKWVFAWQYLVIKSLSIDTVIHNISKFISILLFCSFLSVFICWHFKIFYHMNFLKICFPIWTRQIRSAPC